MTTRLRTRTLGPPKGSRREQAAQTSTLSTKPRFASAGLCPLVCTLPKMNPFTKTGALAPVFNIQRVFLSNLRVRNAAPVPNVALNSCLTPSNDLGGAGGGGGDQG